MSSRNNTRKAPSYVYHKSSTLKPRGRYVQAQLTHKSNLASHWNSPFGLLPWRSAAVLAGSIGARHPILSRASDSRFMAFGPRALDLISGGSSSSSSSSSRSSSSSSSSNSRRRRRRRSSSSSRSRSRSSTSSSRWSVTHAEYTQDTCA